MKAGKSNWTWNSRPHHNHSQDWRERTHACSLGQPTFICSYTAPGTAQKTVIPTSGWGFAEQLTQFRKFPEANLIWAIPPPWKSFFQEIPDCTNLTIKTNPYDQSEGGCQPLQTLGVPGTTTEHSLGMRAPTTHLAFSGSGKWEESRPHHSGHFPPELDPRWSLPPCAGHFWVLRQPLCFLCTGSVPMQLEGELEERAPSILPTAVICNPFPH